VSSGREIKTFEDLKVWQKARELRNSICTLAKELPDEEQYRLKAQLIRASRLVAANIAEGYGRFHYQEYIQYCRQARGSIYEILDHLICAEDQGFINSEEVEKFRRKNRRLYSPPKWIYKISQEFKREGFCPRIGCDLWYSS
jgi:four helix bundle protein